jgi:hypothetical protein
MVEGLGHLAVDGPIIVESPVGRAVFVVDIKLKPSLTVLNGTERVAVTLLAVVVEWRLVVGKDLMRV